MGRTLRTNSSGGGASSAATAGLTLDDIENTFFTRRKLQEIVFDSGGSNLAEFPNLDTEQYESFHLRCQRLKISTNNSFLYFGAMQDASRITAQSWTNQGRSGTSFENSNTSGEMYTNNMNNQFDDAYNDGSFKVIEFNFHVPHPSSDAPLNRSMSGDYVMHIGLEGGYHQRSGEGRFHSKFNSGNVCNGVYLKLPSGNFHSDNNADTIFTLYGTKRRNSN